MANEFVSAVAVGRAVPRSPPRPPRSPPETAVAVVAICPRVAQQVPALSLIELDSLRRLFPAYSPSDDVRLRIVLTAHRNTGEPAKHRQLTRVRERIGNRALKQLLGRPPKRFAARQVL